MARRRWSEQQMRELLQEQEGSGLSLQAFAAAAEVPYTTLSWWRSRLRAKDAAPRLVPVHVKQARHVVAEILVGDVVVRVEDAELDDLARLVRALVSC